MGIYFGSGEGRCPTISKTVYASYTRDELNKMLELMQPQDAHEAWAIATAAGICAPTAVTGILTAGLAITLSTARDALIERFTSESSVLEKILQKNSGETFRLKLSLGCINKGLNGHYWAMRSLALA